MKTRLICALAGAVITLWATPGLAQRQIVPLPYTFGPNPADVQGQQVGIDTTGANVLTVNPNININTTNTAGIGITAGTAGASIVFLGNSTVNGATGTLLPFTNIDAGVTGTIVNFNGTVFSATFRVVGTGTINFNGNVTPGAGSFQADGFVNLAPGVVLSGAVTTLLANTGTLTLNAGSSITGAVTGVKQINFVGGNTSITGATTSQGISLIGGNASFGGTVGTSAFNLGGSKLTITGALATNAGTAVTTTLASNTAFGNVEVAGVNSIGAGITVTPTVAGALTVGTRFTVINGLAAGTPAVGVTAINTNPRYTFVGLPTNIQGDVVLELVAIQPLAAAPGAPPAAGPVGAVLDTPATPGSDLAAIQDVLAVLPAAALGPALVQFAPSASSLAAPRVALQATDQIEDLLMSRVEEIQELCCDGCEPNKAQSNIRKCNVPQKRGNWWGKAFGRTGTQDDVNGLNGYKTDAKGLVMAYDTPVGNATRAGVAVGYTDSSIDGNNSSGRTRIDTYYASGYFSHAPGPWFVQGALTAGADRYEDSRSIVIPGLNRTATSDHSGSQFTALGRVGTRLPAGAAIITPFASLQYSRVNVDGYSEQGAGDINLRVEGQNYDFLQSTLGVKAERVFFSSRGAYAPEVHFKWMHEFGDTTPVQTATFAGGGASFASQGVTQDRNLYNVGAGFTFLPCDCDTKKTWTVKALYDYKWTRSDYSSHQLSVIASLKF